MSALTASPGTRGRLTHAGVIAAVGALAFLTTTPGTATRAVASTSTATSVEAETFALPAADGRVFPDPAASGGAGLLVWSNATATATVTTAAVSAVTVRARGDQCAGAPLLTLSVDGTAVGTVAVPATNWTDKVFTGSWAPVSHRIAVSYPNDFLGGGCDRNLRLDRVTVQSATTRPAGHLFGLSSAGPDQGISTAQTTAAGLGRHLDVVNFYQAWIWDTPLPVAELRAVAAGGAEPEITWEPWDPRRGTDQPDWSLATISGGAHDAYITSWARAAAAYGHPLMIRWGHEMNGSWYPWAPAVNGGSPAGYVAAYRHVHDLFHAAGATNVAWVWSPNIVQGQPTPLGQLYPGPGYVDVIGIDGYNGGTDVSFMGGWRTPQDVFAPTLAAVDQLAPSVPVVVNETGSSENGGSKAAWITELFSYLATSTRVGGLFWFDFATPGQADWRLATSPAAFAAARTALHGW